MIMEISFLGPGRQQDIFNNFIDITKKFKPWTFIPGISGWAKCEFKTLSRTHQKEDEANVSLPPRYWKLQFTH